MAADFAARQIFLVPDPGIAPLRVPLRMNRFGEGRIVRVDLRTGRLDRGWSLVVALSRHRSQLHPPHGPLARSRSILHVVDESDQEIKGVDLANRHRLATKPGRMPGDPADSGPPREAR